MTVNPSVPEIVARCKLTVHHSLLVFIDGQYSKDLSKLDEQLTQMQIIAPSLEESVGGIKCQISDQTVVANPLHLLFISTKACANKIKNEITIGSFSSLTLIEEFVGYSDIAYSNQVDSLFKLQDGAGLAFYKVQNEGCAGAHVANFNLQQLKSSKVSAIHLGLGGKNACENLKVFLEQEHAECDLQGLYLPKNQQNMEYHPTVEHQAANCTSKELFKGVIDDYARAVFDGKVIARAGATNSMAKLNNRNLLLSDAAQVIAKPALEIYVDDVQCTHSATVGQLDQVALWYLQSRGIPASEARQMLIAGFVREIQSHLPEFLRDRVANDISFFPVAK